MTTPSEIVIDVVGYRTDEYWNVAHWRAVEERQDQPLPVADEKYHALLVLCADPRERETRREQITRLMASAASAESDPRLDLALAAIDRLQERAYGDARGRDIADTVIAKQELLALLRALRATS